MQTPGKWRNIFFAGIITLLSLSLSIAAVEYVLRIARPSNTGGGQLESGLFTYHSRLGWTLTRDWQGGHTHHDYQVRYSTNGFGHRGRTLDADEGDHRRYAYLGDSFTFGMGVNDQDTFTEILNRQSQGKKLHLNFGHPGYSTDQELIYAKERILQVEPNVLVLIAYLGNDLIDNTAPVPLQVDLAKPYFELTDGRLALRNTPVPRQARTAVLRRRSLADILLEGVPPKNDPLGSSEILKRLGYKPRAQDISRVLPERVDPSIDLFISLIAEMNRLVSETKGQLIVALLPGQSFVTDPASYSGQYQDYIRRNVLSRLKTKDITALDLGSELRSKFDAGDKDLYYPFDGHLTPKGHRVLADYFWHNLP